MESCTYEMHYSRNLTTAWSLIVVSLICVGIMLPPAVFIEPMPEWALFVYVIAMTAITIAVTVLVMKKLVNVPCTVQFDEQGFGFTLHGKPILYKLRTVRVGWDDISNISMNYDTQHDKTWIEISFKRPPITSSFWTGNMMSESDEAKEKEIWFKLDAFKKAYNSTHESQPIQDVGFYEKSWAKALTWFCWVAIGIAIIAFIINPDADRIGRVLAMIAFAGMWLVNFYAARSRRKKKEFG